MNYPDPNEGKRTWTCLVKMENGVPIEIDNTPFVTWKSDGGNLPSDEYFASQGYYGYIVKDKITSEFLKSNNFDSKIQKLVVCNLDECEVDHENKVVIASKKIVDITAKDYFQLQKEEVQNIMNLINENLNNSEWTQSNEYPINFREKWQNYRNQLLSINEEMIGDPFSFELPEPPSMSVQDDDKSTKVFTESFVKTGTYLEE